MLSVSLRARVLAGWWRLSLQFPRWVVAFCAASCLWADEPVPKPIGLLPPDFDLTGLSPERQDTLVGILAQEGCGCGCQMVMARCLAVMPCVQCSHRGRALVERLRAGDQREAARQAMLAVVPPPQPRSAPTDNSERPLLANLVVPIPIDGDPVRGPASAKITIVEFSDFQCSYCVDASRWVHSVLAEFPEDVRLVFKQAPLPFHEHAFLAAEATLAAHEQGKFWEMHDALFANSAELDRASLIRRAGQIGLDTAAFTRALDERRFKAQVERHLAVGDAVGIEGTPMFYLNGRRYNGPRSLPAIRPVINELLQYYRLAQAGDRSNGSDPTSAITNSVFDFSVPLPVPQPDDKTSAVREPKLVPDN
jgi:protein-disulfide isomerase